MPSYLAQFNWSDLDIKTVAIILSSLSGLFGSAIGVFVTWLVMRPKTIADVHKSEADATKTNTETVFLRMDRFEDLWEKLQTARLLSEKRDQDIEHFRLDKVSDTDTINRLRSEIQECLDGHQNWLRLRDRLVVYLSNVEIVTTTTSMPELHKLLPDAQTLKAQLQAIKAFA